MRLPALLFMGAAITLAQIQPGPGMPLPGPPGMPGQPRVPQPQIAELKAALTLTDQQMTLLLQTQRDRNRALQPIYEQIAERQRTFNRAQQEETNATVIGNIVLDMVNLRKQVPIVTKQFDDQALAILTPDQRPKLQALEDALKKQPAINQAASFGLLRIEQPFVRGVGIGEPIFTPGPRMMNRGRPGTRPTEQ